MKKLFIFLSICCLSLGSFSSFAITTQLLKEQTESYLQFASENADDAYSRAYYQCLLEELDGLKCHKTFKQFLHDTVREVGKGTEKAVRNTRDIAGKTKIRICGQDLIVPTLMYAACAASAYILPEGCTLAVASAGVAGGPCAAAIATIVGACGVSIARVSQIAKACIGE